MVSAAFYYFKLMAYPVHLSASYTVETSHLFSIKTFIALTLTSLLTILAIRRGTAEPVRVASLWIVLNFLPISNIVPIPSAPVADRYLYIPLLGFCLLFGYCLNAIYLRKRVVGLSLLIVCLVVFGLMTYTRNNVWKNNLALWTDTVEKSPMKADAHLNLGYAFGEREKIDNAIEHFEHAKQLNYNSPKIYFNLGNAYMKKRELRKALEHFQQALSRDPNYTNAHINMGIIYKNTGDYEKAIEQFQTALKLNPESAQIIYNLGNSYLARGDLDEAIKWYHEALIVDPAMADAHHNIGHSYMRKGKYEIALGHFNRAIELRPESPRNYASRGQLYLRMGFTKEASEDFNAATKIDPGYKRE
jgi:tetratricopeptide (TPR) repeat protein